MVFHTSYLESFCKNCNGEYIDIKNKWCKLCQIDNLKANFTNWTSGNEKIDKFIQTMQLKINYDDNVFEWISYQQLKQLSRNDFIMWKDGPLKYDKNLKKYVRSSMNGVFVLNCLYNSQNNINEVLSKV